MNSLYFKGCKERLWNLCLLCYILCLSSAVIATIFCSHKSLYLKENFVFRIRITSKIVLKQNALCGDAVLLEY